jgi:hypothetical protein
MPKPNDAALTEAFRLDVRDAWEHLRRRFPDERFYAFGLYTTMEAAYFSPFACGEDGLRTVAAHYAAKEQAASIEEKMQSLRWSIADSPYHAEAAKKGGRADGELLRRPDPFDSKLRETEAAREIRLRMNCAVEALQSLDAAGLFGAGRERAALTLLIEAGDRDDDFVLRWAKKLNPSQVFKSFAETVQRPTHGRFSEFGVKKVYETERLAVSADRRLIATASDYFACLFDVVEMKQLFCRPVPNQSKQAKVKSITISADGHTIAILADSGLPSRWLTILRGKGWRDQIDIPIGRQPLSNLQPLALAAAPDAAWFAVSFMNHTISIFDRDGAVTGKLEGHAAWPRDMAVRADGTILASVDDQTGVHLWSTADWRLLRRIETQADGVTFDPSGKLLATTWRWGRHAGAADARTKVLNIWDAEVGTLVRELNLPGYRFIAARFSPDGKQIAAAVQSLEESTQGAVLLDTETGEQLRRLSGPFEYISDFVFLPQRDAIAFAAQGHTRRPLLLWELGQERVATTN